MRWLDDGEEPHTQVAGETAETVTMIPIKPFQAFDGCGDPLEVVGVCFYEDMPQFVVIETDDCEIWPRFRGQVFKDQKSAQGAANENGACL